MTRAQRAQLAWQVLVAAAHNRQVLTYTIVAERIGMGAGTLAEVLGASCTTAGSSVCLH